MIGYKVLYSKNKNNKKEGIVLDKICMSGAKLYNSEAGASSYSGYMIQDSNGDVDTIPYFAIISVVPARKV